MNHWLLFVCCTLVSIDVHVSGQDNDSSKEGVRESDDSNLLTEYLLNRLLGLDETQSAEKAIFAKKGPEDAFDQEASPSIVYPQASELNPILRYLDEAKENIDVIDFTRAKDQGRNHVRLPRQNPSNVQFSSDKNGKTRGSSSSASEQVAVKLDFPGTEYHHSYSTSGCTNCAPDGSNQPNRWTMPLQKLGNKQYYLGIFFKANWYKAEQYCRFHGMHLASINTAEEQRDLQEHIQAYGMGHEHFWTSGTDQGEEGKFFWLSNGRPITYTNWNAGEPNNFEYEDGEQEHCLEMWDRDGKGLGWNDTPCSFETFFICEAAP